LNERKVSTDICPNLDSSDTIVVQTVYSFFECVCFTQP